MVSRSEKKAETRAALKRAALECFEDTGYAATQIGDISKRAGVAHGTFYVHFTDKSAIVDELLVEFNARLLSKLQQTSSKHGGGTLHEIVKAAAVTCLDQWKKERALLATYAERAGTQPDLQALKDGVSPPVVAFVESTLVALAASTGADLAEPGLVAHALLGMWMRVGLRYLFGPKITRKAAAETLAAMSVGALHAVLPALAEVQS